MMDVALRGLETLGGVVRKQVIGLGRFTLLLQEVFFWMVRPPLRIQLIFKQFEFVGNKSLSIVTLSSLFTGAVLGLQIGKIFGIFKAEGLMGAATGKALALELAPVMCGFIVTGRAGAAMAAEIATMRVNEQLDAMEAMGVSPVSYLIVPRVIASTLMMPLLAAIFLFLGLIGCYILGMIMFKVDTSVFVSQLQWLVWVSDIQKGLVKALVFGFILSTIACYKGFYARGGAKGVGEATTQAVVASLLTILIVDFFISLVQMRG
ncbi:MAG: ABC transporter permease [Betaproteobacteria bacterium]|nr:ABC transporter permease [Betaproteobacteria bacterium]